MRSILIAAILLGPLAQAHAADAGCATSALDQAKLTMTAAQRNSATDAARDLAAQLQVVEGELAKAQADAKKAQDEIAALRAARSPQ